MNKDKLNEYGIVVAIVGLLLSLAVIGYTSTRHSLEASKLALKDVCLSTKISKTTPYLVKYSNGEIDMIVPVYNKIIIARSNHDEQPMECRELAELLRNGDLRLIPPRSGEWAAARSNLHTSLSRE
jgi:hypothetical protein